MKTRLTLPAFAIAAGLSIMAAGCAGEKSERHANEATPVTVVAVGSSRGAAAIRATGRLAAKDEMFLSFKIGGIVSRISVADGQHVTRGQLLAALDPAEINAGVHQAEQGFAKAQRDLDRVKALHTDSVATLEQLQDATTGYEVARATLTAARFNQEHSSIIAPSDGIVTKKIAREHELIGPGSPVLMLSGTSGAWVVNVSVADRDAVKLSKGDSATISIDAFRGQSFPARVTTVAAAPNPQTGTYDVELTLENHPPRPLSGAIAKADIFPVSQAMFRTIPATALVEANGSAADVFVLVMPGNTAKRVRVEIDHIDGKHAYISEGLDGTEQIIAGGAAYIDDNDVVRVARPNAGGN
jgi:RND family efflux transporter MFP subunit